MKKILKLFVTMLGIVTLGYTSSCSKDNDTLIVGKWKLVSSVATYTDPETGELTTDYDLGVGAVLEFTEDGKVTFGGAVTTDYSISGDIIYVYDGEEVVLQMEIKKLTGKELTLFYDIEDGSGYLTENYEKQ